MTRHHALHQLADIASCTPCISSMHCHLYMRGSVSLLVPPIPRIDRLEYTRNTNLAEAVDELLARLHACLHGELVLCRGLLQVLKYGSAASHARENLG